MLLAVRGDLVRVLTMLLKERKVFDGIIIETTGVVSLVADDAEATAHGGHS